MKTGRYRGNSPGIARLKSEMREKAEAFLRRFVGRGFKN